MVRPGLVPTLVVGGVVAVCVRAGFWQLSRYSERTAVAELRESRHALSPLDEVPWSAPDLDYRRVRLTGTWRASAVATGGIPYSRNGYAAIGVLHTDRGQDVLVLRGWVPADGWERWLAVDPLPTMVEGVLRPSEDDGLVTALERDGQPLWPLQRERFLFAFSRGVTLPIRAIAAELGARPEVYVVAGPELEDLEERDVNQLPAGGYTTYLKTLHHLEYTVQWFAFAAIAVGLWLWYGWRRRST